MCSVRSSIDPVSFNENLRENGFYMHMGRGVVETKGDVASFDKTVPGDISAHVQSMLLGPVKCEALEDFVTKAKALPRHLKLTPTQAKGHWRNEQRRRKNFQHACSTEI